MGARIRSSTPNFVQLEKPTTQYGYIHGADVRQSFMPVAFQVTSPFNNRLALLPHALVMHVNPASWSETHAKKKEMIQTRGGYVEQHWFDELSEISADGSTGAFINIYTGLTSLLRQRTIAWDRFRDLYDLYRNNGSVYDPYGNVVLQGNILLMYDRGTYIGYFRTIDVEETEESPFAFKVSWTFKVQETVMRVPGYVGQTTQDIVYPDPVQSSFEPTPEQVTPPTPEEQALLDEAASEAETTRLQGPTPPPPLEPSQMERYQSIVTRDQQEAEKNKKPSAGRPKQPPPKKPEYIR